MPPRRSNTAEQTIAIDPEGAHPVLQARSRQLRDKALAHARDLVEQGRFADTTMAEIARAVGCSVGALYFRFHDKDALLASAVEVAMARELGRLAADVDAGRYRVLGLHATVTRCVDDFVAFFERNDRMIRTLHQRDNDGSGPWGVVRATVFEMNQHWLAAVADAAGRAGDPDFIRQAGIGFQFTSGVLVHQALTARPVRPLGRRELVYWLDEMVMHFIGLDVPEALRRTPVVRPPRGAPGTRPRVLEGKTA
jgi:AcrR family transcriptional regulator